MHHKKRNGSTCPLGLSGDLVCLSTRLMAVAAVRDASIAKYAYKE
ncbi:hypothetical protein [Acidovorax sp. LjRoot74]